MKRKILFFLTALCFGLVSGVKADEPYVYQNSFDSEEGLTKEGNVKIEASGEAAFGNVYKNLGSETPRSSYLVIPSDVLRHSTTSNQMTIAFWVKAVTEAASNTYQWAPIFTAFESKEKLQAGNWTHLGIEYRGTMEYNLNGPSNVGENWCDFVNAQQTGHGGGDAILYNNANDWLRDKQWHHMAIVYDAAAEGSQKATIYIDAEVANEWTLDGTTAGQNLRNFFANTSKLGYVCFGGCQIRGYNDNDAPFWYDDLYITNAALSASQISNIIDTKLSRTTLLEYGTNDVPWTTEKVAEWTAGGSPTLADGVVTISGGNGGYETSKAISPTANSFINVTAVWRGASGTGRAFSAGNGSYFRFGNIVVAQNDQDQKHGYVLTGLNNISNATTFTAGSYRVGVNSSTWLKIEAVINTATNKLLTFTIKSENGATTYASVSNIDLTGDYTTVAFGYKKGGGVSTTNTEQLKSVKITQTPQPVTNVDYTINYKLGDNLVKSISDEGVVDQVITADVAIDGTEEGYIGNHYLIVAAEAPSMTLVDGENVLDVPVRVPYTATLKVTTTIGVNDPVLVETPLVETDAKVHTWSYAYPMYVLSGGKYYIADNTSSFGEGGEFTDGQIIEKTVTYSTVDESVVFFQEGEASAGTNYSYSYGGTGVVPTQNKRDRGIYVGTLPAGIYSFTANITAANRRALGIRQSTNDHIAVVGTSNEDLSIGIKSANFSLNEETSNLYINGANSGTEKTNQSEDFDYVIIKKLPATVSKTISAAKWATYCSPYILDFSSSIDNLDEAYIVTGGEAGVLTLVEVDGTVPANTGLLLKGEGECVIPVAASSSVDVSANKLVGVTSSTELPAENGYVLMGSPKVGFYKNANVFTVGANTAYLPIGFDVTTSDARIAFFGFDEDPTAINAIEAAEAETGALKDGKYLIDNKVVIVKNGVKYSANGQILK